MLDFSVAFDIIDQSILVHRHHTDVGFTDADLQYISSYLTVRTQKITLTNYCYAFATVHSVVPQGSVLGAIHFTMHIQPISAIIDSHSIIHHSLADVLQLQMFATLTIISELLHSRQSCIGYVKSLATTNILRHDEYKTELMLATSKSIRHLHSLPTSITICNAQIPFKHSVTNMGFELDWCLSVRLC